jgi:acetolactate synthase-1/2/3 large subunit
MKKLSDIVIDFFYKKGFDTAFTVSGGGCIHLIDSLARSQIQTICTHHEQAALMASEGYYRMSNKMSLNIVTTGPGGTNTLTGLLGLWLDSIPSIIISGQVQKNQLSEGTGCRQIGDQELDIIKIVKPITKYAKMIVDANSIFEELEKAYKIALEGRPGPVWIDIPLDIQAALVSDTYDELDSKKIEKQIDTKDIEHFTELLKISKKPVIIVGNGIRLANCYQDLNDFLIKSKIPVVTGPHSGVDAVDNSYEYYAGRIGILGQLTSNQIIQEADLIIALGTRLPVKMTGYNIKDFSPNSKKIIVDIDENEINKHKFNIDLKIVGNLRDFFNKIKDIEFVLNINYWQNKIKKYRSEQVYVYPKHKNLKDYVSFYYLINKSKDIFKDTPIVTSNGTAHVITLQTYQLKKDQRLFTNVGCASMGYGLPAAIGACIANNKKPVICIEGDGSLMMNLQEIQTVVGYKLPLKLLVINNEGYLSIKLSQEAFFKGNEFASGPRNGVTIPNYQKIANAFNIKYLSIRNNEEIDSVLNHIMKLEEPCFIEIFTHPKERHEPKVTHKGIAPDGKIIPGSLTDMYISEIF